MSPSLDAQLESLERRGRLYLAAEAHRTALAAAWRWCARVGLATAALLLVLVLAVPHGVPPVAVVGAWVAASIAALAAVYGLARHGERIDRRQALALFDRAFFLNDRVTATDEFLRRRDRGGFREAALDEASPWLDYAIAAPLPLRSEPERTPRRWPFVIATLLLLALAMVLQRPGATRTGVATVAGDVGRTLRAAIRGVLPRSLVEATGVGAGRETARREAGRRGDGAAASSRADRTAPSAAAERAGAASGQAGDGAGDPGRPSRAAPGGAGAPGVARADAHRAGDGSAAGGPSADPHGDPAAAPSQAADGAAGSDKVAASRAAAPSAGQAPAGSPMPSAQPRAAPPPSQTGQGKGAQPTPPNQQGAGQKGGQGGSQNQSQSRGEGQGSGRGAGQDAVKKTRGISSMLLAVPLDDRLIGVANPARVASVTRPSTPQAATVGRADAQDRGGWSGDDGTIVHRIGTRHEALVVRAFFRRREPQGAR